MGTATITLGRDGMGEDADEADFGAWTSYVAERIDDMTGLDCTVEEHRQGDVQETRIDADSDADDRAIQDAIETLWTAFCADTSAWPARALLVPRLVPPTTSGAPGAADVACDERETNMGNANIVFARMTNCGPKKADWARELLRSIGRHLAHGDHVLADQERRTLDDLICAPHAYTDEDVTAAAKQAYAERG